MASLFLLELHPTELLYLIGPQSGLERFPRMSLTVLILKNALAIEWDEEQPENPFIKLGAKPKQAFAPHEAMFVQPFLEGNMTTLRLEALVRWAFSDIRSWHRYREYEVYSERLEEYTRKNLFDWLFNRRRLGTLGEVILDDLEEGFEKLQEALDGGHELVVIEQMQKLELAVLLFEDLPSHYYEKLQAQDELQNYGDWGDLDYSKMKLKHSEESLYQALAPGMRSAFSSLRRLKDRADSRDSGHHYWEDGVFIWGDGLVDHGGWFGSDMSSDFGGSDFGGGDFGGGGADASGCSGCGGCGGCG